MRKTRPGYTAWLFAPLPDDALQHGWEDDVRPPASLGVWRQATRELADFRRLRSIHPGRRWEEAFDIRKASRHLLLRALFNGRRTVECHYCGDDMRMGEATFDHVRAHAEGGSDSLSNMVLCCQPCNVKKADLAYIDFLHLSLPLPFVRRQVSRATALINRALTALEPSLVAKLDESCAGWGRAEMKAGPFPLAGPATMALYSLSRDLPSETDPDRILERLDVVHRLMKLQLLLPKRILSCNIAERDWQRMMWHALARDCRHLEKNPVLKQPLRKTGHVFGALEPETWTQMAMGLVRKMASHDKDPRRPGVMVELAGHVLGELEYRAKVSPTTLPPGLLVALLGMVFSAGATQDVCKDVLSGLRTRTALLLAGGPRMSPVAAVDWEEAEATPPQGPLAWHEALRTPGSIVLLLQLAVACPEAAPAALGWVDAGLHAMEFPMNARKVARLIDGEVWSSLGGLSLPPEPARTLEGVLQTLSLHRPDALLDPNLDVHPQTPFNPRMNRLQ